MKFFSDFKSFQPSWYLCTQVWGITAEKPTQLCSGKHCTGSRTFVKIGDHVSQLHFIYNEKLIMQKNQTAGDSRIQTGF